MNFFNAYSHFWLLVKTKQVILSSNSISLYMYLLNVWNEQIRPDRFVIKNIELQTTLNIKHHCTLSKARQLLIDSNLIIMEKVSGEIIFYSIVDSSKNELVVPTTTAINEVSLIYNSIKKVKSVKSINLDAYLPISLRFHQKQKEAGLSHPEFVNPLTVESRIVINGAITLEKLNRLDREPLGEIKQVLDGILEDSFWRKQIVSLSSIRKNSGNGNMKYFNAKNSISELESHSTPKADFSFSSNMQRR